ncbi:MAG: antibiotic biosynthesis monooxygenase [Actinobacteria bacterium]|nr:antibiotic biosynthesis monooxygenase [Actinomycetota bacterium]
MFGLVGSLTAAEGRGDELEGYLLEASRELGQVSTCHLYLVSRVPDEPEVVHVVEVWDDEGAHRASLELAAVQRLISRARPIIVGMGDRVGLRPVGGKGLDPTATSG